jgi:pyruvyltransferase
VTTFRKILCLVLVSLQSYAIDGLPLYYYREPKLTNFGDILSLKLVERIVGGPIRVFKKGQTEKKLLAIGSIFFFAAEGDVVWGSGINGKTLLRSQYSFDHLDVRAVRGPLTRQFLMENFHIEVPEVYGDPSLLIPCLFPEFQRKRNPKYPYLVIPHYRQIELYPKDRFSNVAYPTDPWEEVIDKILDAQLVISNSLHGIAVAESFGIPARMLAIPEKEYLFKYQDYYAGTGRPGFRIAKTVEEAIEMGGEPPAQCDLKKLYEAFPFEFWPGGQFPTPIFP